MDQMVMDNICFSEQYYDKGKTKARYEEFNSNNTEILNVEQVKDKLLKLDYIQEELREF